MKPVRTPEIVEAIIDGVSKGQTLRQLCRDLGISKSAWYEWMKADDELSGRFARARIDGFDEIAEECLEIADDGSRDYAMSESGAPVVDHDHIQRSKLRIETRLKLLAKWDPKRYGELLKQEHSGPNGGPVPVQIEKIERVIVKAPDSDG